MSIRLKHVMSVLLFLACTSWGWAQVLTTQQYEVLKQQGNLPPGASFAPGAAFTPAVQPNTYGTGARGINDCGCYQEVDTSWTEITNWTGNLDDGSFGPFNIPFDFCLYGTNYNSGLYININGNVSFGQAYSTFSAVGFPSSQFVMVAPFWGDVDLNTPIPGNNWPANGKIYYKITNTALYVNWVDVGYFNSRTNRLNKFSLIMTDGNDPVVSSGNVAFCYKDMQWTTGQASQGDTVGLGGIPATVGANKGDGIEYIQFGRFDDIGNAYDGPLGNSDGVDWLDNQSFFFNSCSNSNITPIAAGITPCDTLRVCLGDTLDFDLSFLAPEVTQITTATVTSSVPGFTVLSNTSGLSASLTAELVGISANIGTNIISISASDNGTPPDTLFLDIVVVVDSIPLNPVITGNNSFCLGDSTQLDAGNTFQTYLWNTGDTSSSTFVTEGDYVVTVTELGCTEVSDTFSVAVIDPTNMITGDSVYCVGGTFVGLDGGAGFDSYLWSTGDTTQTVSVDSGVYAVTVTLGGCVGIDTFRVFEISELVFMPQGDTVICDGDSTWISIGNFDTYLWNTGDTVDSVFVAPGSYVVTVTKGNCTGVSDTISITNQSTIPPVIAGDTSFCEGDSSLFTASAGYSSYLWSNGDTSQSTFILTGDSVQVIASVNGCQDSTSLNLNITPLPAPMVDGPQYYCPGFDVQLTATASLPIDSLLWSTNETTTSIMADSGTYQLKVYAAGCSDSILFDITVLSDSIAIIGDSLYCEGTPFVVLDASPSLDSYLWNTPNNDITSTVQVQEGAYRVTVTQDTCVAVSEVFRVEELAFPTLLISGDTFYCTGDSAELSATSGYGTYAWSTGDTTATIQIATAGVYTIQVSDATGFCVDTDTVTVAEFLGIKPTIIGDLVYCHDDSTVLSTAIDYASYAWGPGGEISDEIKVAAGVYTLTATDTNGCTAVQAVAVDSASPQAGVVNFGPICPGDSTMIGASRVYSFMQWSNGSQDSATRVSDGTHTLIVGDDFGCRDSITIDIPTLQGVNADFSVEPPVGFRQAPNNFFDESTLLGDGGGISQWRWDFDDGVGNISGSQNPVYTFPSIGDFNVTLWVETTDGCRDTVVKTMEVLTQLAIPNVVTPNGDGYNEYLIFEYLEFLPESSLRIYNRWGTTLYETEHYQNNWDGYNLPDGVYFFVLDIPRVRILTGSFTLLHHPLR